MKPGLAVVTCANCHSKFSIVWPGKKWRTRCPTCNQPMTIGRQRLKDYQPLDKPVEDQGAFVLIPKRTTPPDIPKYFQ